MALRKQIPIDWESYAYKRARFHYVLQIIYGEALAIDYCTVMSSFAPTEEAKQFLLQQKKEEDAHLELLTDVVSKMDRPHERISPATKKLHKIMKKVLKEKDWPGSILVQNFIVEGLALSLCEQQGAYGDDTIHAVFSTIITDEVRHVAFGVDELKKVLESQTDRRVYRNLIWIQRKSLFYAIMIFKDLARDANKIGVGWDNLAYKVLHDHMDRITQAGFRLPLFDRVFLTCAIMFFKVF